MLTGQKTITNDPKTTERPQQPPWPLTTDEPPVTAPIVETERPEQELLLCCVRPEQDDRTQRRIRALAAGDIDWRLLLALAQRNDVDAMVYRVLAGVCADSVPEPIRAELKEAYRTNAARNLYLTAELLKVLDILKAAGIPAVPYKGPVLAGQLYGDIALRKSTDLDILMARPDVERATEELVAEGYQLASEVPDYHEKTPFEKHERLMDPQGGTWIELHWQVSARYHFFPVALADLSPRLEPTPWQGTTVSTPAPEDQLLLLCAHGSGDCFNQLISISDIARLLLAGDRLNWAGFLNQLHPGGRRRILIGLALASRLLGAAVPRDMFDQARADKRGALLVAESRDRMCDPGRNGIGHIERCSFHLRSMERLRDKVWYCLGLLRHLATPNHSTRSLLRLPGPLHWLYHILHPMRLAWTYGTAAARQITRHGL